MSNADIAYLGHIHLSIGPQRLPDIAVQRVHDDLLAAVAEARVPQGSFVKEGTRIVIASNSLGSAFGDISNSLATNAVLLASTILQPLPDVQEELQRLADVTRDLPLWHAVIAYHVVAPVPHCLFEIVCATIRFAEAL